MITTAANDPGAFGPAGLVARLARLIAQSPIHVSVGRTPARRAATASRASADRLPAGYDAWDVAVLDWIASEAKLRAPRILFM